MQQVPSTTALWEQIRKKPGLYLGECSITALYHAITGYNWALGTHHIENDDTLRLPEDFHEWVAYRLHFYESTSGWKNMLLKICENEEAAFQRFFELLDEHQTRNAHVVARVISRPAARPEASRTAEPRMTSLVAYTDDPGFFAIHNDLNSTRLRDRFYPLFKRSEWLSEVNLTELEILDADTFARWETEATAYRKDQSPYH